MLLVIAYSRTARRSLRNVCRTHEGTVVRRFGRVALLEATAFGAFQALRLQEKHGVDIQIEWVEGFDPGEVDESIREAARAYEGRSEPHVPYESFAADTDHPSPERLREQEL